MFSYGFFYVMVQFSLLLTGIGAIALIILLIKDVKNKRVW